MRRLYGTTRDTPLFGFSAPGGSVNDYAGKHWGFEPTAHAGEQSVNPHRVVPRRQRLLVFVAVTIVFVGTLGGRLMMLQFAHGTTLRAAAENNRIRSETITALRGIFTDRAGLPLVRNVANFTLILDPQSIVSASEKDMSDVASILGEDRAVLVRDIDAQRSSSYTSVVLREHLPTSKALALLLRTRDGLPGFRIEEQPLREYLGGPAFAPLLGYIGKLSSDELPTLPRNRYALTDRIGKSGLERSEETLLKGTNGSRRMEVDARGRRLRIIDAVTPIVGPTIRLTVDSRLQQAAYDALLASIDAARGTGGAAIAVDPRNGEIRAFVSAPSYDPNIFSTQPDAKKVDALLTDAARPLFNRALQGQYPSGSTIKPFVASVGLDEGIMTATTTVRSTGGIRIGQWFFPDWKAGGHGVTDVRRAIADSINTFFYMVGGGFEDFKGLGVQRLTTGLARFGFGLPSGIELGGEAAGLLPSPEWKESVKHESWYIGDTYHLAIGQGDILVTPLQMALATAAAANGGTLYRPHLIEAIETNDHQLLETSIDVRRANVMKQHHLAIVREGMRLTVTAGSAKAMQGAAVPVAAKTGTAQYGSDGKTHAWFTAFAPYENPELVVAVIVEGGGEGGTAAQPVARAMIDAYFGAERPRGGN